MSSPIWSAAPAMSSKNATTDFVQRVLGSHSSDKLRPCRGLIAQASVDPPAAGAL
jgi:hypothetical protein